ncbi:MAG: hypothetical protein WBQ85_07430 [Candidatus Sulfotelmatobacter sp.]
MQRSPLPFIPISAIYCGLFAGGAGIAGGGAISCERGRQTVEEFVRLEAAHDLNHLRQIDRILGGYMTVQS